MLNEKEKQVLSLFAKRLREIYPEARIWAYGSRVQGNASPDSDLDLCVVLNERTPATLETVSRIALETGFEHDILLSGIIYTCDNFENGPLSTSPLVQHIREKGCAA